MFNFLKDKLKGALSLFSKKVEEKAEESPLQVEEEKKEEKKEEPKKKEEKKEKKLQKKSEKKVHKKELEEKAEKKHEEVHEEAPEEKEELPQEPIITIEQKAPFVIEGQKIEGVPVKEEKGFFAKLKEKFVAPKEEPPEPPVKVVEEKISQKSEEQPAVVEEKSAESAELVEGKKGFFSALKEKITTKKISADQFDELFWDVELVLLENNVAVSVIEKIKDDLKSAIVDKPLPRAKIQGVIVDALRHSIATLFDVPSFNLFECVKKRKPFVICCVGVNGSGKTTTIAKLAYAFEKNKISCVLAAADTFRAAAIDQLQVHADALGVKLIKHTYGADAAAVAFDAIKHAEAKGKDVVLIDTAGRLHSNVNLMDEMKKIIRVAKPDLKLFIGESITGNDCVEQARLFDEAVGIDGVVLSKADIDEKGGAALSISYVTKKPILYLGTGQNYDDLELFDKEKMIKRLGL